MRAVVVTGGIALVVLGGWTGAYASEPQRPSIDDIMALRMITSAEISPDGSHVAFAGFESDFEADKDMRQLWLVPVSGGKPVQLTHGEDPVGDYEWSADSAWDRVHARRPAQRGASHRGRAHGARHRRGGREQPTFFAGWRGPRVRRWTQEQSAHRRPRGALRQVRSVSRGGSLRTPVGHGPQGRHEGRRRPPASDHRTRIIGHRIQLVARRVEAGVYRLAHALPRRPTGIADLRRRRQRRCP